MIAVEVGEVGSDGSDCAKRCIGLEAVAHALELPAVPGGLEHVIEQANANLQRLRRFALATSPERIRFGRSGSSAIGRPRPMTTFGL